ALLSLSVRRGADVDRGRVRARRRLVSDVRPGLVSRHRRHGLDRALAVHAGVPARLRVGDRAVHLCAAGVLDDRSLGPVRNVPRRLGADRNGRDRRQRRRSDLVRALAREPGARRAGRGRLNPPRSARIGLTALPIRLLAGFPKEKRHEHCIVNAAATRIGFVGLGLMGHGIAKNLIAKGFPLTIRVHRNRKPAEDILAAGAREVKTNAELARASDVVILCVTGSPQIEEIIYGPDGILGAAREGLIVVDTSTAEPSSTAKIRGDLAPKGTRYVDAPLARTPKEAEEGRLNPMVGADDATFAQLKPILSAYCENVIHVGGPGHGHMLKLVNNFMAMAIATATAEACAPAPNPGCRSR